MNIGIIKLLDRFRDGFNPFKANNIKWVIVLIVILIFYLISNRSTTTGNPIADKELQDQKTLIRPETGELDFKKK